MIASSHEVTTRFETIPLGAPSIIVGEIVEGPRFQSPVSAISGVFVDVEVRDWDSDRFEFNVQQSGDFVIQDQLGQRLTIRPQRQGLVFEGFPATEIIEHHQRPTLGTVLALPTSLGRS